MQHGCLFCGVRGVSFATVEHIIPESLGNTTFLLSRVVCDKCNQYFSKLEDYFVHHYPTSPERLFTLDKTKKGKPPLQKLEQGEMKREKKGRISFRQSVISGKEAEQLSLTFLADTVLMKASFPLPDADTKKLSRFLAKAGLETLYFKKGEIAFTEEFNSTRRYARFGDGLSFVPFLWGHQQERQVDVLPATAIVKNCPGIFFFAKIFVPGSIFFVPLNRLDETVALEKVAKRYSLNKVMEVGTLEREPPRIQFVWGQTRSDET